MRRENLCANFHVWYKLGKRQLLVLKMKTMAIFSVLLCATIVVSDAQAEIFKCKVGDNVVFQDSPCGNTANQSKFNYEPETPAAIPNSTPSSQSTESLTDRSKAADKRTKRRGLQTQITDNEFRMQQLNQQMNKEIEYEKWKSTGGRNNLVSAMDRNTSATRINGIAAGYANQIKVLETKNEQLRFELSQIKD